MALATFFRAVISASTISLERATEKRQSVVKDKIKNLACAGAKVCTKSLSFSSCGIKKIERFCHQNIGVGVKSLSECLPLVA